MNVTLKSLAIVLALTLPISCAAERYAKLNDRKTIYNALVEQVLLDRSRTLVHMVHICNLVINNQHYPVIDIIEHVKGAQVPRAVSHILILDSALKSTKKIYHDGSSRPLYCKDNQLFLLGYLAIDSLEPEGNVLSFSDAGKEVTASEMETNDFPAQIPPQ